MSNSDGKRSFLSVVGDGGEHRQSGHAEKLGSELDWTLRISGAVENPSALSLPQLWELPVRDVDVDALCVSSGVVGRTPSGRPCRRVRFSGVPFPEIADLAQPKANVQTVRFISKAPGGCGPKDELHDTAVDMAHCMDGDKVILCGGVSDAPLPYQNGGPLRSVVQDLFFYKSLKWLAEIHFTAQPLDECQGTWERYAGYHNRARIAEDERFQPFFKVMDDHGRPQAVDDPRQVFRDMLDRKDVSRMVAAQLNTPQARSSPLATMDFAELLAGSGGDIKFAAELADGQTAPTFAAAMRGMEFRSQDYSGWNMAYVNFSLSRFYGVRFRNSDLSHGDFEGAKFFNVDSAGANFQQASMRGAVIYQSDFSGANLRGANLDGAMFHADKGGKASTVNGLDVTGAVGLGHETADWLREHGAIGAAPV